MFFFFYFSRINTARRRRSHTIPPADRLRAQNEKNAQLISHNTYCFSHRLHSAVVVVVVVVVLLTAEHSGINARVFRSLIVRG